MRFPNLKKHFFAHVLTVLFYLSSALLLWAKWLNTHYPSEEYTIYGEPTVYISNPGDLQMYCAVVCIILGRFTIALLIGEILVRKFIIEKNFPNFKFPFSIKIPKWICIIHSIFFYFGFITMIYMMFFHNMN